MEIIFKDREHAGKLLVGKLAGYKNKDDSVVCGITRGGVVVAKVMAEELCLPLIPVVMKKIGAPFNKEFAIGSIDPDGNVYLSDEALMIVPEEYIRQEAERLKEEIKARLEYYGISDKDVEKIVKDKVCIVVDDGVATGLTTIGSAAYLRRKGAKKVVLAVPVIPADKVDKMREHFDDVIFVQAPVEFYAVGQFYMNFEQVSDDEVKSILKRLGS